AVAGTIVDPHFTHAFANRRHIARIAERHAVDAGGDPASCPRIDERAKPCRKLVGLANLQHVNNVAYTLQFRKPAKILACRTIDSLRTICLSWVVLLARGAVMGRCEGGAAVGREAGDAAFRAHRVEAGKPASVDAAPAGRLTHSLRSGGPGQPSAGITTGCPPLYGARAARGGDEGAAATAPDRGLEHGPRRCPE